MPQGMIPLFMPSPRLPFLPLYELQRETSEDGSRIYATPEGSCSSVTTILSNSRDNSGLELWREYVGEKEAERVVTVACARGNGHHTNIENFLATGEEPPFSFLFTPYWTSTRSFLDRITQPLLVEGAVWHPDGYAGTLDCLAYLDDDDTPTLLDWKTAETPRKPIKMYEYSLQIAAYVAAANYVYASFGLNIRQAKIVVALKSQEPQIESYDSAALEQLFLHFQARLHRFTHAK